MAGSDPRRSSRARTTQSQSQISSTTSSVSGRGDRNTRHFNKGGSPQKSTSTASLSSEPFEDSITADDTLTTRRRTRGQNEDRDRTSSRVETADMANGDDSMQEEDEAVRCICGYDDYPGPPPDEDVKHSSKDDSSADPLFNSDATDDVAGFFVQCDICKVWQHGACVGITVESSRDAEYFCEQCRKDLHKVFTASNGQRYSHYLPLRRHSRTTSRAASLVKDGARSPPKEKETRSGRASAAAHSSKRRSTMNSREAAYDEAEALRRAIEASKEDAAPEVESTSRRPKRGRSDSEEKQESVKRQRTSSRSASPSFEPNADDSDDTTGPSRPGGAKAKTSRSGAATTTRNQHQRNERPSEREERERQRAEAANKRKGRAERRRADGTGTIHVKVVSGVGTYADTDSDPSEELPLAARAGATASKPTAATAAAAGAGGSPNLASGTLGTAAADVSLAGSAVGGGQQAPAGTAGATASELPPPTTSSTATGADTPPAPTASVAKSAPAPATTTTTTSTATPTTSTTAPASTADKKRSHKKKGRNQYTRDAHDEDSPARSQSRDIQKDEHAPSTSSGSNKAEHSSGNGGSGSGSGITKSHSKAKGGMSSKITMTDMKRRATALFDYITRTQVELAGETMADVGAEAAGVGDKSVAGGTANGDGQTGAMADGNVRVEKEFTELNCVEMMDSLSRRLIKWQTEYA